MDLIITSPPYFNAKEYSSYDNLNEYYETMKKVFSECYRVLKTGTGGAKNYTRLQVGVLELY